MFYYVNDCTLFKFKSVRWIMIIPKRWSSEPYSDLINAANQTKPD